MRENKQKEITKWCEEHNLYPLNIRNFTQSNKTRIKITLECKECGQRFDCTWNTLTRQDFPGLCACCAYKKSQDKRRLSAQKVVDLFAQYDYKVITPLDKIKPTGKNQSYNRSNVEVEDKNGIVYKICWNNFLSRLQYYIELNDQGHEGCGDRQPSCLEQKVIDYLIEKSIKFKREYKIAGCRGKKRMSPFDFCLNYTTNKVALIEVDGERHYKPYFAELQKNDKAKNYYCQTNNIPLLRIPYWEFDDDTYKRSIDNFIKTL